MTTGCIAGVTELTPDVMATGQSPKPIKTTDKAIGKPIKTEVTGYLAVGNKLNKNMKPSIGLSEESLHKSVKLLSVLLSDI